MISSSQEPDTLRGEMAGAWRLEDILKTEELARRSARSPNYQAESEALVALSRHMAESPETLLQTLVETAMTLSGADSAGISIEEQHNGEAIFRWRAVAGRLSSFLGGTMPHDFSPCGVTVRKRHTQLMVDMERYYPYVAGLQQPLQEVLLVPFERGGRAVGTLWVVSHERPLAFDAEDARILGSLSQFAAAAVETVAMVKSTEGVRLQLQQAQTQLASALDAGAIATWEWDLLNDRVFADAYCARLFSLTLEEASGAPIQRFVTLMHPEDRPRVEGHIRAAIDHDAHYEVEYRLQDGPGHRWVLARGKVLRDASGKPFHFSGVVVDITLRKQSEMERETLQQALWDQEREVSAALREARDQAVAASRAKDDFLAALSHELRTPLNPVLLLASDMAQNPEYSPEVRSDFETVRKNVELEARLIDDLLDLTRITNGKLKLDVILIDLHAIVREALDKVAADAQEKDIRVDWHLHAEHSYVQGDPVRLQQVFWNVLKNAVKFTPHGGTIRIASQNQQGTQEIKVAVHDSGVGIAAKDMDSIFNAFAQGAHAGSHVFGGLGLGLAISQRLMQMHAGYIEASSAGEGRGSCFAIHIPGTEAPAPQKEIAQKPVHTPAAGLQILLIEDHLPSRQILERLLTRRGHTITTAGSGQEACERVQSLDFDLVICDVGLPDTDGHTLLQDLSLLRPGLNAIAMTGYGSESDMEKSDRAGFLLHLTKPVSIARLDEAILSLQN